ncbi:MAG: uroporphyrinogen decarboxylase [Magnetovibrio sp.]|nr:uroporphyrinogen decarboxylase [Magnetovibrio sp.]
MTKRFLQALKGETLSPPPIWLMRQAGRYLPEYRETRSTAKNFLHFCYTPDLAVEVTLQPLRRYNFDAAILFSDILVIPDALGQKVEFVTGQGPQLEPIKNEAELEATLDPSRLHEHLDPVYTTVHRLSKEIPETTALIGFAGAPWTVATYMVEGKGSKNYEEIRSIAYTDPVFFQRLMDMLVDATSKYLIEQVHRGAECLQVFDSWAGVLSEKQFYKWSIEPMAKIVERVKAVHPDTPIIGFPRGAGPLYEDYIRETKVDGVGLDHTVPLEWARDTLQPLATVQGTLDNLLLVAGGEAMDAEVKRIIDTLGQGPFIFNLGHGIVPQTPPEHVERLCALVRGEV